MSTYIKFMRDCPAIDEMARNGHYEEIILLMFIAKRARRTPCRVTGLDVGEAMIGDYKNLGMTERKYRTAKNNLEKWGFSTYKTTNKGTIAKLIDSSVYDINVQESDEQSDGQATDKRRASDGQATTNKNDKNDKNEISLPETDSDQPGEPIKITKPNGKHSNKILFEKIAEIYNERLGGVMPNVQVLSEKRQRLLKARCSTKFKNRELDNPEFWTGYFNYVSQSEWLTGKNQSGWTADFDWLIEEKNFIRVLEGSYHKTEANA